MISCGTKDGDAPARPQPLSVLSVLVAGAESTDPFYLRGIPLLVAKWAHVPCLQPPLNAVQMEYVPADPCAAHATHL